MPMPSPGKDQDQKSFMADCMSDEHMMKQYPENDQRVAVCLKQWRGNGADSAKKAEVFKAFHKKAEDNDGVPADDDRPDTDVGFHGGMGNGYLYIPNSK